MILAKVIFTSIFLVMSIFFASIVAEASLKIKEAKALKNAFEEIDNIKNYIDSTYNQPYDNINKEDLLHHLPKNSQERITLLNETGNFEIHEKEKLKVFILKNKVKSYTKATSITANENHYTFYNKNTQNNDKKNDKKITHAIEQSMEIIYYNLLLTQNDYTELINTQTPYFYIYQENTNTKDKKRSFFKQRLKNEVILADNFKTSKVLHAIRDFQ